MSRQLLSVLSAGIALLSGAALPDFVSAQNGEYIYHAPQAELIYDNLTGVGAGSFDLVVEEDPANPTYPSYTQGFSMGIGFPDEFVTLVGAAPTGVLAAVNDGDGPDFFGDDIDPVGGPGFVVGVVYALGADDIVYVSPEPVIRLDFETVAANLAGGVAEIPVPLQWADDIGDPPVGNTMVAGSITYYPLFADGELLVVPAIGPDFIRGDADGDGVFTGLIDGVFILLWNFQGGPAPPCLVAADADGDESLSGLVDALYVLAHQFTGGPPPPAPYPFCGADLDTQLDCDVSVCP